MKTRKAWIAAVLALAMVLGMAGCSNRGPTAKELMAGVPEIDLEKYNDMELEMNVTAQADGQTSTISMAARFEGDGNLSHLNNMEMSLDANGVSLAFSMEAWMGNDTDLMYSHMSMFGQDFGWMLLSSEPFPLVESLAQPTEELRTYATNGPKLVLEPHTEGEDYVVTWSESGSDVEDFSEMFGGLLEGLAMDDVAGSIDQVPLGNAVMHAHFDEETHELKLIRIETEAGADGSDDRSSVLVVLTYHTLNGTQTLNIPQSVIDTAVDARGLM